MNSILIVDASPLIYSVYNKVGHLKTTSGIMTGVRFGVLRSLRSWKERCKAQEVILVYDSPTAAATRRGETGHEGFKANRPWTDAKADMYSQVDALKELIALTNFYQVMADGYEADEIVINLAKGQAAKGHKVFIASVDADLKQAVQDPNIQSFEHSEKGANAFLTEQGVFDKLGVWPHHLPVFKAVMGDKSDNIKGVWAQSENAEMMSWLMKLRPERNSIKLLELWQETFHINSDRYEQAKTNLDLVLPRKGFTLQITKGVSDADRLSDLFVTLEFKSMMKHIPELTIK